MDEKIFAYICSDSSHVTEAIKYSLLCGENDTMFEKVTQQLEVREVRVIALTTLQYYCDYCAVESVSLQA